MLAEYSEAHNLQTCLVTNYSRLLNPRLNQSKDVSVDVQFYLNSVIDFKPVSGLLTLAGVFILYWEDEVVGYNWQRCPPTSVKIAKLSIHEVWIPQIYIRNTASSSSIYQFGNRLDSETSYVTYNGNGSAKMSTIVTMDVICKTDVTYYPLDTHMCGLTITASDGIQHIQIFSTISSVVHPYTYSNSEWDIDTKVINSRDLYISEINFAVYLSRKPTFVMTNLVFPVIVITVVIGFSFLVPIDSGERLSFGISLLLMFIVFLTTVVDILPSTDNTLSYFNIFIFMELIYSCLIVIGIIVTLFLHYHSTDTEVPTIIRRFAKYVLRNKRKISPQLQQIDPKLQLDDYTKKDIELTDYHDKGMISSDANENNMIDISDITWKDVAKATDKVFRIITSILSGILILIFVVLDITVKLELY